MHVCVCVCVNWSFNKSEYMSDNDDYNYFALLLPVFDYHDNLFNRVLFRQFFSLRIFY